MREIVPWAHSAVSFSCWSSDEVHSSRKSLKNTVRWNKAAELAPKVSAKSPMTPIAALVTTSSLRYTMHMNENGIQKVMMHEPSNRNKNTIGKQNKNKSIHVANPKLSPFYIKKTTHHILGTTINQNICQSRFHSGTDILNWWRTTKKLKLKQRNKVCTVVIHTCLCHDTHSE